MSLSTAWGLLKQSLLEYAIFIPLDLWAKSALKHSTSIEERQHIWESEAQLILIGSIIALVWHRVYPVVSILLAFFCYRSSQSPSGSPINVKEISLKGLNLLLDQTLKIWLFISVEIGNLVSKLFDKIRGRSDSEQVAEAILLKVGTFIAKCINFVFRIVKESVTTIYRNCVDWEEIFRSGQWYTYQCVSQEQFLGQPPDVSSDRLLCHPECELSQRNPCRATSNVNGNHIIQEQSKKLQTPGCNSPITSTIRDGIKTRSKKFLKYLRCFLQSAYFQLQQCQQIQFMPYTVDTPGENLCFMNTVLHCFTREPSLTRFLNETVNEQSVERLNLSAEETQFLQSLQQLLANEKGNEQYRKQFSRSCSMLIPTLVSPPGKKQQQQDVVEFAQWLLNTLHHCFKTAKENNMLLFKKSSKGHMLLDTDHPSATVLRGSYQDKAHNSILHPSDALIKSMQQYANLEWLAYTRENSSPITNNFTGQMVESYQCTMCNQISAQRQTFIILPLALPTDSSSVSLQDIIKKFLDVEDMEGKEGCWCNYPTLNSPVHRTAAFFENSVLETPIFSFTRELSAKTSTPLSVEETSISDHDSQILSPIGTTFGGPGSQPVHPWYTTDIGRWMKKRWLKRTFISKAPKYLILQLMRFQFDNKSLTKNHHSVLIPLYNLCIPLLENSPVPWELKLVTAQREYELCAIIVHLGAKSMSCGHYVAYVRSSEDPNVWHRCDDHTAVKVDNIHQEVDSETIKENAYLLFYKQTRKGG